MEPHKCRYSSQHSVLVLAREFVDMDAKTTLGARSDGGVRVRPCSGYKYSRVEQFTANRVRAASVMRLAYNWALLQIGKPYDYSRSKQDCPRPRHPRRIKWFCSELLSVQYRVMFGSVWMAVIIKVIFVFGALDK